MAENELDLIDEEKPGKLHFEWLVQIFVRPFQTLNAIAAKTSPVWLLPLLVMMASSLVLTFVNQRYESNTAQMENSYMPMEEQMYFEEQGFQEMGQPPAASSSTMTNFLLPLLGKFAGIWIGWFLLGGILHLVTTLNGSRSSNQSVFNITAWAMMPLLVRDIVQILATFFTKQTIAKQGLAGFVSDNGSTIMLIVGAVLAFIDIYLIWQMILMAKGIQKISGFNNGKAWISVALSTVIFMGLNALPVLIATKLSSLSVGGLF